MAKALACAAVPRRGGYSLRPGFRFGVCSTPATVGNVRSWLASADSYRYQPFASREFRVGGRLASPACHRGELESELVLDVERLGAGRLVIRIERDLLDLSLSFPQQRVAMGFQRLAPLIDQDRGLELHVAFLQAVDDGVELLQRLLEAHILNVGVFGCFGDAVRFALLGC